MPTQTDIYNQIALDIISKLKQEINENKYDIISDYNIPIIIDIYNKSIFFVFSWDQSENNNVQEFKITKTYSKHLKNDLSNKIFLQIIEKKIIFIVLSEKYTDNCESVKGRYYILDLKVDSNTDCNSIIEKEYVFKNEKNNSINGNCDFINLENSKKQDDFNYLKNNDDDDKNISKLIEKSKYLSVPLTRYKYLIEREIEKNIELLIYKNIIMKIKDEVKIDYFTDSIQSFVNKIYKEYLHKINLWLNVFCEKEYKITIEKKNKIITNFKDISEKIEYDLKEAKKYYEKDYKEDNYMKIIQNRNKILNNIIFKTKLYFYEKDKKGKEKKEQFSFVSIDQWVESFKVFYIQYFNIKLNYLDFFQKFSNNKICEYCGISESLIKILKKEEDKNNKDEYLIKTLRFHRGDTMEIDRRNSKHNYSNTNIALACYWCNNAKGDEWDDIEFKPIAYGIHKIWNQRIATVKNLGKINLPEYLISECQKEIEGNCENCDYKKENKCDGKK